MVIICSQNKKEASTYNAILNTNQVAMLKDDVRNQSESNQKNHIPEPWRKTFFTDDCVEINMYECPTCIALHPLKKIFLISMDLDIYWMNRVPQFFPNNIRRPSSAYAALWRGSIFNLLIPSFFLPSIYKKWKEISCVRTRTFSVIYAFIQSSYRAGDILLLCMKTSSGFNFHKIIIYCR